MPYPGTSTAVARQDLGGLLESFDLEMDRRGFIGNRVLPIFAATKSRTGPSLIDPTVASVSACRASR